MTHTETFESQSGLLSTFLAEEKYWPTEPQTFEDIGLTDSVVESLICKYLAVTGTGCGRSISQYVCLPFRILHEVLTSLRTRQILVHCGSAPFNDYYYSLTEDGRNRAENYRKACSYVGPAPVRLDEYINSVQAQSVLSDSDAPTDVDLVEACRDISVESRLFDLIGPAANSGAGIFLYGAPGNGKSTLAQRITKCFGRDIWIPHTIIEDGQIIKFRDSAFHRPIERESEHLLTKDEFDRRWIRVARPTVIVGGELTLEDLELRHDPISNVSEAPLQMKSNGGCLLIDDFGRQRATPAELLNRWIVPLESKHDFLRLVTGKKIQVPFEQLVIFSTNIAPRELVDEAFLRRIPYKIEITDPTIDEFKWLFKMHAEKLGITYLDETIDYLVNTHYEPFGRPRRRCHPRDLLLQIRNLCRYRQVPLEMTKEYFDIASMTYFAMVFDDASLKTT